MIKRKFINILEFVMMGIIVHSNFNCCTNTCLKRTIEWNEYIAEDYTDNTKIISSEKFKEFQKEFPINENKIDSFANVISSSVLFWVRNYDSLFQNKPELNIKLRINSKGFVDYLRTSNTFKFDTNRVNTLKNNLRKFKCSTALKDTMVEWEFSFNLTKTNQDIIIKKSGPVYSVFKQRTKEEILKVANKNLKPMKKAFENEISKDFCAHGKIVVRFVIREDGSIPICKIVESSYCNTTFENKIVDLISAWKFPILMSTFDNTEIIYPFVFNRE